jgi:DNA polymerase I-like protein with 3'-5' exonuclease and polymerase domains
MLFLDTETCGLCGPAILIQYARDNGEIILYDVWTNPVGETLRLIEEICEEEIVGFNLAFDWFQLQKLYNLFCLVDPTSYPEDIIDDLGMLEASARDGLCIKPKNAFDLMLHARKGPYQSTMDREDLRIKKVPTALAWKLAEQLDREIKFNNIYFARKANPNERWKVYDIENDLGDVDPNFKDIVLKFAPSSALKALAVDALNLEVTKFKDIACDVLPNELGFAPFATAVGNKDEWNGAWPWVISIHISHWTYNTLARQYAEDDVFYTRALYKYFSYLENGHTEEESRNFALSNSWFINDSDKIPCGDDDSILACMVGSVRWKGFAVDIDALKEIKKSAENQIGEIQSLATAPHVAKKYLESFMNNTEKIVLNDGTKKTILEEISKWEADSGGEHLAATAAKRILEARRAKKKIELINKLIIAGRLHASYKVIGTLSSRMSGADGLNPQGIGHEKIMRKCFTLAFVDFVLCGGDFKSFEITLADAEYNDPDLRADLKLGKKIHALLGEFFFPDKSYDEIVETQGTDDDLYVKSKQGVFALIYGGEAHTLSNRVGINKENAEEAYQKIITRYKKIGEARKKVFDAFCSMRQPEGIGTKVEWHEPADYIESMLGFRRYFTLENRICKTLFRLAESPPKEWLEVKFKVVRRDRQQTACGAVRSALFASAFAIQAANMRAAANHRIQSTGAQINKKVERRIWDLQPYGINLWLVLPMNNHDENMIQVAKHLVDKVEEVVKETVEHFRKIVPLIGIDWKSGLKSWADK